MDRVHGTDGGYYKHRRKNEVPCKACVEGHRLATAERRERNKLKNASETSE